MTRLHRPNEIPNKIVYEQEQDVVCLVPNDSFDGSQIGLGSIVSKYNSTNPKELEQEVLEMQIARVK